jgi:hypothetical protein
MAQLHSLSSQLGGGKEGGGEGAGAEAGAPGMAHPMPLPGTMGTMPFVPTPEILLLLLRGYASELLLAFPFLPVWTAFSLSSRAVAAARVCEGLCW